MHTWPHLPVLFLVLAAAPARAAERELMPAGAAAWKPFAPRPQNAPVAEADAGAGGYVLKLSSGGKPHVYGGWRTRIVLDSGGLEAGAFYRFRARVSARNIADPRESLGVQLRWRGDFGEAVAPTYVWDFRRVKGPAGPTEVKGEVEGELDRVVEAPPKTRAVEVELILQWTAAGQVAFEDLSLTRVPAPAPRKVRVAAVWLRPRNSRNGLESVERFAEYVERVASEHRPDVVVLGEMINRVGARGEPDDQAEPIPGPTTERIGEMARQASAWIAFSMVERDGGDIFNTGVLLDRQGRISGKYRKVQLPFEEVSRGFSPGSGFPVFTTDFGRVGMLICHDASFPQAARELALQGAELILMPIWGGRQTLVRARAMENGVYVATSGYDYDSEIIDPLGRVLASASKDGGPSVAVAEIDLSRRFREDWIGDWNDTLNRQQRRSAYLR